MLIIFGTTNTTENFGRVGHELCECDHCGNSENWELIKQTDWVELFFIRIIPYKSYYYYACPICGHGYNITNEKFNELLTEIQRE